MAPDKPPSLPVLPTQVPLPCCAQTPPPPSCALWPEVLLSRSDQGQHQACVHPHSLLRGGGWQECILSTPQGMTQLSALRHDREGMGQRSPQGSGGRAPRPSSPRTHFRGPCRHAPYAADSDSPESSVRPRKCGRRASLHLEGSPSPLCGEGDPGPIGQQGQLLGSALQTSQLSPHVADSRGWESQQELLVPEASV